MTTQSISRGALLAFCALAITVPLSWGQAPAPASGSVSLPAQAFKAEIANPLTISIRHSMEQRISRLVKFYEPGVIGLANDGRLVTVGDLSAVKLGTRQIIEKLIDAENDDRHQLLAAVTQANGHEANKESDLAQARAAWVPIWRSQMKPGWMVQDDAGHWAPKS